MSRATTTMETRKSSYDEIKESLSERQKNVFNELTKYKDGATASELAMNMWKKDVIKTPDRNNVHPRLNELVEKGVVTVEGKRECSVTGKTVAIYTAPKNGVLDEGLH
ncbi:MULTISPECIES: hypothetical protein [Bacillus cereus group]|uniref:Uncharacterized protein n=1 Tax=Bacillus thuringiensis TaxID=1428 RepID=A0A9X7AS75_BACTU|nr:MULTISPECIES: hypothetical protein [Bacillus cereus group]PFT50850.1 hypothetical protein COK72_02250 [Bacillus thuringiensis]PFY22887.1 hypothetical protein COL44_18570 [Bacillus toyonensis]